MRRPLAKPSPAQAKQSAFDDELRTALGLYEMLLREKTRFASVRPVLRLCAAALLVPLV